MDPTNRESEMLDWLKDHPEIFNRLEQMRLLAGSDPDLDDAELELLELSKAIGAEGLGEILQLKSDQAAREMRQEPGIRNHGKKN